MSDFDNLDSLLLDDAIINKPKRLSKNPSKKRQKKTKKQKEILEAYYEKNNEWSNELVEEISSKAKLTLKQVAKWNWDQKNKKKSGPSETFDKPIKRQKINEDEEKESDSFGNSHKFTNSLKLNIKEAEATNPFQSTMNSHDHSDHIFKNDFADFKEKESVGTISMIDGLMCKNPDAENKSNYQGTNL
jgi:hypothetical protein